MQTSKLNHVLRIASLNKSIIRNVAANNKAVIEDVTTTKSWREIPGPSSLPLIGQLHHFLPGGSMSNVNTSEVIEKLHATYGPIMKLDLIVGKPPIIVLADAESSAQVQRGENWLPHRPGFGTLEYYREKYVKKHKDEPAGLLSDHGEIWKKFRSTVNPVLLQPKTIKLYSAPLEEVAQDMITSYNKMNMNKTKIMSNVHVVPTTVTVGNFVPEVVVKMKSIRGDDNMLKSKFDVEMNLWSLESVGVVALGDRLNCLDPNLPEDSPARKLIQVVHDFFIIIEKLDFQPSFWRYFSTPMFKKAMRIYEEERKLTKYFVNQALKKINTNLNKSDDEKGVLEKLLEIDENIAYIMASDMLFAGVDTTANTMTYTLYLLAKNPEKQEILREEVMTQKDKRPYLKACIKESLRLLPVIAGSMRLTTKEYNLMGYKIPKNTFVTFSNQQMSLSETHYKRAKEFIPERWLVPKDDPLYHGNAHPFAYAPFGFGVRSCIGRRIAELEIEIFLAKIMENFKVDWTGPPLKIRQAALSYAAGPFYFTFKDI